MEPRHRSIPIQCFLFLQDGFEIFEQLGGSSLREEPIQDWAAPLKARGIAQGARHRSKFRRIESVYPETTGFYGDLSTGISSPSAVNIVSCALQSSEYRLP
jgi:hypothetical protein